MPQTLLSEKYQREAGNRTQKNEKERIWDWKVKRAFKNGEEPNIGRNSIDDFVDRCKCIEYPRERKGLGV